MEYTDWYRIPRSLKDRVESKIGSTFQEVIESKLECPAETHKKEIFKTENHYGYYCTACFDKCSDWIAHENLSSKAKQEATPKSKIDFKSKERHDKIKSKVEKRFLNVARELCHTLDTPDKSAPPEKWREYMENGLRQNFWERYKNYLESDAWASRRDRCFNEKGMKCTLRLNGCDRAATEIHHTSYEKVGHEPLTHLEPACKSCHNKMHEEPCT